MGIAAASGLVSGRGLEDGAVVRYAVVLDYREQGMPDRYVIHATDDPVEAADYAEAFALGCCVAYLPNGERGLGCSGGDGSWRVQRRDRPPAEITVKEV
jgi:hypothetical protein